MKDSTLTVQLLKTGPPNDTIFILGATGCGKTTLIANLALKRSRFVIFDTKEDFPAVFFPGAVTVNNRTDFRSELSKGTDRIIVQMWITEDPDFLLDECIKSMMVFHTLNPGLDTTFILDEANRFCWVNHCSPELRDVITRGRGIGIRKILGAQWFGTLPTWMRDSFTEIYSFRHTDENGTELLEQFGFDANEVTSLPQYVCLYSGKSKLERISLVPEKSATTNK